MLSRLNEGQFLLIGMIVGAVGVILSPTVGWASLSMFVGILIAIVGCWKTWVEIAKWFK